VQKSSGAKNFSSPAKLRRHWLSKGVSTLMARAALTPLKISKFQAS